MLVEMIVLATAILGAIDPRRPLLWAPGVGAWIPLHNLLATGSPASLVALAAAYFGAGVRKLAIQPN